MLIRIKDFVFDINKVDSISFNDFDFRIGVCINGFIQPYPFTSETKEIDEYIKTKEFLLNMCPDIATDEGRNNFLNAVKYVAKLQGFKGDSVEKNNSENPN